MSASRTTLPVKKNDDIDLYIHGLNHEGMGVGRYDGYTLFVKHALPQETIRAKVIKTKKNFGYARLMDILEKSTERVEPLCPIYRHCGGCQLQHLAYDAQLIQKRQLIVDQLQRIGRININDVRIHETIGMDEPWRYRNKAQIPIGEQEGGLIGGFYRQGTNEIIDMQACLIQHEQHDDVIAEVKAQWSALGLNAYKMKSGKGLLRHVVLKYGFATDELMIILITNGSHIPHQDALIRRLRERFPNVKSIAQNINTTKSNVIFGSETTILWGEAYIYDRIGDVQFAISPRSFYQVNPVQTEKLYTVARQYAALSGNETVIDAYCGIGTISLFLAEQAAHVYGVEVIDEAVADAKRNARLNHIDNATFAVGEAEKVIPWWKDQGIHANVIVVDPPRKGCDESLLQTMADMQPQRIVYVSCNPSTLARDIHVLADRGYDLQEVQPVDMFPHTSHVECVALMSRIL